VKLLLARIGLGLFSLAALVGGCGSSSAPAAPQLGIAAVSGAPLSAVAGDAVALQVVVVEADGSTHPLSDGVSVTWTSPAVVTALPPGSTAPSPLPVPLADPTGAWIDNPGRPDRNADLAGVLFVYDPGTVQNGTLQVSATVRGGSPSGDVTASILVDPTPAGDWTRCGPLYAASCASCHGPTGHGSPGAPEASSYVIGGQTYDYPAPGLNAEPGNTAWDPAWNAALFAIAARADVDNGGLTLRLPMPDWLTEPSTVTSVPLTTQDLADIYAFLKTQTQ
jgi:mono/diheme cytochrome c family protein